VSQPGTWVQEVMGPSGGMSTQGGTSITDENCYAFRLTHHMTEWIKECNEGFALDPSSITSVTGYTEGVYEDVWLFPSTLTNNLDDVTTLLIGPIIATVTIDANGACTDITPTLKNGQYFTGETLTVYTERSGMGEGSAVIEVDVATGTENRPSMMGNPYWTKTTSWSIPKKWTFGYGRRLAISDIQWTAGIGTTTTSSSGSTSWSHYNYYIVSGWSSTYGRAELVASADTNSFSFNNTFDNSYLARWYYNSEPGQEAFIFTETKYWDTIGWVHHDTTEGYNGSDIMVDWSSFYSESFRAMQRGAAAGDDTSGTFAMGLSSGIGRGGYVKPLRTLECKNWVIAGGNKNLVSTYSTTSPTGAVYTNGTATISYRQISNFIAGRIL